MNKELGTELLRSALLSAKHDVIPMEQLIEQIIKHVEQERELGKLDGIIQRLHEETAQAREEYEQNFKK